MRSPDSNVYSRLKELKKKRKKETTVTYKNKIECAPQNAKGCVFIIFSRGSHHKRGFRKPIGKGEIASYEFKIGGN